jgi:hypothetical protein
MSDSKPEKIQFMTVQDDDAVFEQAVLKMRQELAKGKTFAEACEVLHDIDEKLRPLIKDDFLKIVIAEQHFGQGRGIDDVALFLDLPYEIVEASRTRIMREFDEILTSPFDNEISPMTH